jgi:hypothetical protein
MHSFDPERVPTVGQLLQELDLIARQDDQAKNSNSGMSDFLMTYQLITRTAS